MHKTGFAPANTPGQTLDRSGEMSYQNIDPRHPEHKTNQNSRRHPQIKPAAHAKQGVLCVQAQKHPLGIVIGRVVTIKPQRIRHAVDPLLIQADILDQGEIAVPGFLKPYGMSQSIYFIIKAPFSRQGNQSFILLLHSQQIPRLAVVV